MNFVFSMFFFAVWPGGRRCANCRDAHFFERYCDESIFTWKTCKTTMEKTKKNKKKKVQTHGQGLGRGLAGDMGLNVLFFFVFPCFFCSLAKTSRKQKKQKKIRPMGKVWAIHTNQKKQKTKNTKNQETKKPKNKKKKKTKKKDCTPQGEGVRCRVLGLVFFFCFFFLVCVWIAIADVPSRDQALSVVALEARSIHYSTAMFAMT